MFLTVEHLKHIEVQHFAIMLPTKKSHRNNSMPGLYDRMFTKVVALTSTGGKMFLLRPIAIERVGDYVNLQKFLKDSKQSIN